MISLNLYTLLKHFYIPNRNLPYRYITLINRIMKLPYGFDFSEIKIKTLFILLRIIKQDKFKEK